MTDMFYMYSQENLICVTWIVISSTVDQEIFTLKIIRVKNVCVDKISQFI